jgi:hypothetical protein
MIWGGYLFWAVIWAIIGSFGTAFVHERQGRDVTEGGLIGLLVGAVGSIFFLTILWLWLYYGKGGFMPREKDEVVIGKRWYEWWN